MPTFKSKPHTIEAVQFQPPFKEVAPDWLLKAYRNGRASMTYLGIGGDSYMSLYNDNQHCKAFVDDWICLNSAGTLFVLSDEAFKSDFEAVDNADAVP